MGLDVNVLKELLTLATFYGKVFEDEELKEYYKDLDGIEPDKVCKAIKACRMEMSRFPKPADIIKRLPRYTYFKASDVEDFAPATEDVVKQSITNIRDIINRTFVKRPK